MYVLPSPDGAYIALLHPEALKIFCTGSRTLRLSQNLKTAYRSLCWDACSGPDEYRLALVADTQVLAIGFSEDSNLHGGFSTMGKVTSVQWTPMRADREKLVPNLASICSGPDTAKIQHNDRSCGEILRPKSQFVPVERRKGWAILHSRGTNDRVTFFGSGRILGSATISSRAYRCIAGAIHLHVVAVAYASELYLVRPNRVLGLARNLVVTQMAWMASGSLIALIEPVKVVKLSLSLAMKPVIMPTGCRVYELAEKQVLEVASKTLKFSQPRILGTESGEFCAIQCKSSGFVYVFDRFGDSVVINYRASIAALEWQGDKLCFKFKDYGVVWSQSLGFQIIDHCWPDSNFVATNDGYLVWTRDGEYKLVTTIETQLEVHQKYSEAHQEYPEIHQEYSEVHQENPENLSLESDPPSPFRSPSHLVPDSRKDESPRDLHFPALRFPTLSPKPPHDDEDTFYYKRTE